MRKARTLFRFLISHGANVNANVTRHGHAFSLIAEGIGPPNPTPLGSAAEGGHADIIAVLIRKGAKVNGQDGSSYTPLMWACEVSHLEAIKELLRYGADVNVKTDLGQTALSKAQARHDDEVVALLNAAKRK